MEDTEWNDILRKKGIIKDERKSVDESNTENAQESLNKNEQQTSIDDLLELDDDDDIMVEYRRKRMAEMQAASLLTRFGDVREITASDYVQQVNKAGDNIWVVLLLYQPGIPLCSLLNKYFDLLAAKFPTTKFLKSIASLCVPNFPEANLPSIFIYQNGSLKKQLINNSLTFGGSNLSVEVVEWILSQHGAVKSDLEEDPRIKLQSKKIFEQYLDDDDDI